MFKSTFRKFVTSKILCPLDTKCQVLNCVFLHSKDTNEQQTIPQKFKLGPEDVFMEKIRSEALRKLNNKPKEIIKRQSDSTKTTIKRQSDSPLEKIKKKPKIEDPRKKVIQKKPVNDVKELVIKQIRPFPPSTQSQRTKFLRLLNSELKKNYVDECLIPNKFSIDLEYQVAKDSTSSTYTNNFKSIMVKVKRKDDTILKQLNPALKDESKRDDKVISIKDEKTKEELYQKAIKLIHPVKVLKSNDYVMEIPEGKVETLLKKCERCHTKFDPNSTSIKVNCQYHPGRKNYSRDKDHKLYYSWSCCQQIFTNSLSDDFGNSESILGCKNNDFHVFKDENPVLLHNVSKFMKTPSKHNGHKIVGLDAEMVYTNLGFEMARLTIVDFFQTDRIIFDKLIQPLGKITDYNTAFSGITEITPENSITWEQFKEDLFKIIGENTILIGHGLENDLNVMRLIHFKIIDTAILFKDGMKKVSLKNLSKTKLNWEIQTGEHDSAEDSIAAIRLVYKKLRYSQQ